MTTRYRCDFLDVDRIAAICVIECDDDAVALLEAGRILETAPYSSRSLASQSQSIDYWQAG
jgi:hypothetical protein